MNRNKLDELIEDLKNLFVPGKKKLVPVKVYVPNNRRKSK